MAKSSAPATKADLAAFEKRVVELVTKLHANLKDEMDRQFQFVAEKLTDILGQLENVDEAVEGVSTRVSNLERRVHRLEDGMLVK